MFLCLIHILLLMVISILTLVHYFAFLWWWCFLFVLVCISVIECRQSTWTCNRNLTIISRRWSYNVFRTTMLRHAICRTHYFSHDGLLVGKDECFEHVNDGHFCSFRDDSLSQSEPILWTSHSLWYFKTWWQCDYWQSCLLLALDSNDPPKQLLWASLSKDVDVDNLITMFLQF